MKIILFFIVNFFIVNGCLYAPVIKKTESETCQLYTKKLELKNIGDVNNYPQGCTDKCVLLTLGITSVSFLVSGTVVIIGNTIHWIEKEGTCKDSFVRKKVINLVKNLYKDANKLELIDNKFNIK